MSDLPKLLSVLAHEMRTPLAAILGYQELLSEGVYGRVDERGKEPLERIKYAARQLLHLIDGVQEISDARDMATRETAPFDPGAALRACVARATDEAVGRSVRFEVTTPPDLPQLNGDVDRFSRSIELAITAAIKTSPGATLQLTAGCMGDQLRITIAHTGLSPTRDDPASVTRGAAGEISGPALRLAIARQIARGMRGDLALQPEPEGTTLVLSFA